jgi:pimeloyl-ACP methyl ester carboxylesterase
LIGESDPLFVKGDLKNEAKLGEQGSFEVIENASHMIPLEKAEACLKWILKFEKQL